MFKLALIFSVLIFSGVTKSEIIHNLQDEIEYNIYEENSEESIDYINYYFGLIPVGMRRVWRLRLVNNLKTDIRLTNSFIHGFDFSYMHWCRPILRPNEICEVELIYWPRNPGHSFGQFSMNFIPYKHVRVNLTGDSR